ncbi:MAG TPA: hypothetical protein VGL70_13760 [Candidatus Binatia bacterium]|jgi:hypothetical protein
MKKLLSAGLVTAMLLAGSSTVLAGKKATASLYCGTTYSVGAEDGSLLIQHHGKFSLITVGSGAEISNGKGQALTLEDIRPGDWIEYWSEQSAGKTIIRKIAVNAGGHANCSAPTVLGKR